MSNVSTIQVLTPPASVDLTTLETLREELGLTSRKDDKKLTRWIHEASEAVQDYLRRPLGLTQYLEVFDHEQVSNISLYRYGDPWKLRLQRYPIASVDSVAIDDATLDPANWAFNEDGFLTKLDTSSIPWQAQQFWWTGIYGSWVVPGRKVSVTYWAGYALVQDLPRAIETATLSILRHRFASGSRDPTIRSESAGGMLTTTYWVGGVGENAAIPPEAISLLQTYREIMI